MQVGNMRRANRRLQLTAFGARDRCFFDTFHGAPRRQLKRSTFGGSHSHLYPSSTWFDSQPTKLYRVGIVRSGGYMSEAP